jgi:hypothetical protein
MKSNINEREINQRMIKLMTEEIESTPQDTAGNAIAPTKSDVAKSQEEFRQLVASDAKFVEFNILPDANNVIFKGGIPGICQWKFELTNRQGPEIMIEQPVNVTEDIIDIFKTMHGVFMNWKKEWDVKLTEYQQNSNG